MSQPDRFITKEQLVTMITDKESLYDAYKRNGFYMPSLQGPFITIKFLVGIR